MRGVNLEWPLGGAAPLIPSNNRSSDNGKERKPPDIEPLQQGQEEVGELLRHMGKTSQSARQMLPKEGTVVIYAGFTNMAPEVEGRAGPDQ